MTRQDSIVWFGRSVVGSVRENQIQFLAAAVAFYGFLSIIPLILLALGLGILLGFDLSGAALSLAGDFLTPAGQSALADAVGSAGSGQGATVVGLLVLLWSSLKVFRALDIAFSEIYGNPTRESLPSQVVDALTVLVGIPLAVVAMAVLGVILPYFEVGPLARILGPLSLVVALTIVFVPMFYTFPDVDVNVREVLPGAVFTGTGWTILATVFGIYTQYIADFALYGVLGAALLLVTWLYLGGIIIMVGAVVNAVLAGRTEDEDEHAVEEEPERAGPAPDVAAMGREVRALREELDEKTVSKEDLEHDLERYVRRKVRRSKARGWGPYLVLLYGTVMTLGALYWMQGGWAIFAMIVIWLSTLGLYVLMVLFGVGFNAIGAPGAALDWVREKRS